MSGFPTDLRRRSYNTLALPCECVIYRVGHKIHTMVIILFKYSCMCIMICITTRM